MVLAMVGLVSSVTPAFASLQCHYRHTQKMVDTGAPAGGDTAASGQVAVTGCGGTKAVCDASIQCTDPVNNTEVYVEAYCPATPAGNCPTDPNTCISGNLMKDKNGKPFNVSAHTTPIGSFDAPVRPSGGDFIAR